MQLLISGLCAAGKASPRVAVCGLNPHNADNGAFGREEIDVIAPGVELARSRGFVADGPFPADTAFVRAIHRDGGGYDGVLTMCHDQGQIAMKLMGFERGVTVPGGLPMPIATPAHGTAYDITGQGVACGRTEAVTDAGLRITAMPAGRPLARRDAGADGPLRCAFHDGGPVPTPCVRGPVQWRTRGRLARGPRPSPPTRIDPAASPPGPDPMRQLLPPDPTPPAAFFTSEN